MLSDKLKKNGVKIISSINGVGNYLGSGIVYLTPSNKTYNYVLTAKHTFQQDIYTPINIGKIDFIRVLHKSKDEFKTIDFIKKDKVSNSIVVFDEDLVILLIKKVDIDFKPYVVSDNLESKNCEYFSWGISASDQESLVRYKYSLDDQEERRFTLEEKNIRHESLKGLSGAGLFSSEETILFGIINKFPFREFHKQTIDCTNISFSQINEVLNSRHLVKLDLHGTRHKKIINGEVIDIHQATINNVRLDIELARKRLEYDLKDDWFHDPLNYIDLLNQDYLFEQLKPYFEKNIYKASLAEQFYVPKKTFALRQALVSPFLDRIIYFATVGVLAEKLDSALIPQVYSARFNKWDDNQLIIKGVEQWKKMKYQLAESAQQYNCVLEIDILNFYDNISKELLFNKILRVCDTENEINAAKLLYQILQRISIKKVGLPQNSDASSLLATFYLNQIDVFIQKQASDYYRFMDDIRIFCNDKYEARKILQTIETELRRCHLSVNSQKTEIFEFDQSEKGIAKKKEYTEKLFDLELNQIQRMRSASNKVYRNLSFHASLNLLIENLGEDLEENNDSARRLNYALNTFSYLGRKGIWFYDEENFKKSLQSTIDILKDKPWITRQVCNILNLMHKTQISYECWTELMKIVLDEKYNTYSLQSYQIWFLLARHKYKNKELMQFAVKTIEKNDETMRPAIAAMTIYLASVDNKYKKVILRKFGENFTHGYFQNRNALVALRYFPSNIIPKTYVHKTLSVAHDFLHKYKEKDLIYIQGATEEFDNDSDFEQLYSI